MAETNQSIEMKGLSAGSSDLLRVLVLAVNLVLIAVALPVALARPTSAFFAIWLLVPLLAAGLGAFLLNRRPRLATWILLYVFPISAAALVAAAPSFASEPVFGPITTPLVVLSFVLYCGVTAGISGKPRALLDSSYKSLPSGLGAEEPQPRRFGQRLLVVVVTLGAIAIALVAPLLEPAPWLLESWSWEGAWGANALAARILSLVFAGTLAVLVLGFFLAPALRRPRRPAATRSERRKRSAGFLVPAVMGLFFYLLYQYFV